MYKQLKCFTAASIGLGILLALTASVAGGQQSASPETAAVKAAIEAANARFLDAFKRADASGMAANYSADAILMMPNQAMARGNDAIQKALSAFVGEVSYKDGAVTTADVMLSGDLAVETGTFQWTLQPKTGPAIKDSGKYLTVWKRQADGSWKIVRDINNSDLPPKM